MFLLFRISVLLNILRYLFLPLFPVNLLIRVPDRFLKLPEPGVPSLHSVHSLVILMFGYLIGPLLGSVLLFPVYFLGRH